MYVQVNVASSCSVLLNRLISLDRYGSYFSALHSDSVPQSLLLASRETNRSCYWANSQARYALLTNAVIKFVFSYRRRFFNLCPTLSNILHFPSLSFARWPNCRLFLRLGATIRALYRLKGLPIRKVKLIVCLPDSRVFRISLSSRPPFIFSRCFISRNQN